jgi:hypothetical protein
MPMLNLFLIKKYDDFRSDFGEGDGYATGNYLLEFFEKVIKGSKTFDSCDFFYNPPAGAVGAKDLVCYMLSSQSQSIVSGHTSDPLGPAGSTVFSTRSKGMISEIYLNSTNGDADRARLAANLIAHEWMHNKLDAHPSKSVISDVHAIKGGRVSRDTVNTSSTPNDADVAAMRKGIALDIPQHKDDI